MCWVSLFQYYRIFTKTTQIVNFTGQCRRTIPVRWKTFILLWVKHIHDSMYRILWKLAGFCRRCDKAFWCVFSVHSVVLSAVWQVVTLERIFIQVCAITTNVRATVSILLLICNYLFFSFVCYSLPINLCFSHSHSSHGRRPRNGNLLCVAVRLGSVCVLISTHVNPICLCDVRL